MFKKYANIKNMRICLEKNGLLLKICKYVLKISKNVFKICKYVSNS